MKGCYQLEGAVEGIDPIDCIVLYAQAVHQRIPRINRERRFIPRQSLFLCGLGRCLWIHFIMLLYFVLYDFYFLRSSARSPPSL